MARYFRRGKTKIVAAPAVASKAAPTRAEINAGTVLAVPGGTTVAAIAEMDGFTSSNEQIETPDANSEFTSTIPGPTTVESPQLTFYDDDASSTIRTALAEGTETNLIIMPYGDVATKRCEVWPVRVAALNDELTFGNEAARYIVQFAPREKPAKNAVVPA